MERVGARGTAECVHERPAGMDDIEYAPRLDFLAAIFPRAVGALARRTAFFAFALSGVTLTLRAALSTAA